MTYLFKTSTHMKPYNSEKYWILNTIIPPAEFTADSVKSAIEQYRDWTNEHGIEISKNAVKSRQPMYRDFKNGESRQVGYVFTGKSLFDKGDYTGFTEQYVDLWTSIQIVSYPDLQDEM